LNIHQNKPKPQFQTSNHEDPTKDKEIQIIPNHMMHLQQTIGNKAVAQLLTGKGRSIQRNNQGAGSNLEEQEQEMESSPDELTHAFQSLEDDSHTLCLEQHGDNWVLMMHSEPIPLKNHLDLIKNWINNHGTAQQKTNFERARLLGNEIDVGIATKPRGRWAAWRPADGTEVELRLTELATLMESLPGDAEGGSAGSQARPASSAVWTTTNVNISNGHGGIITSTDGTSVDATVSINPGNLRGTEPQDGSRSQLLNAVNAITGGQARYIAGHLLNHHLHGKGDHVENLAPISSTANGLMESTFESNAKKAVLAENKVLNYKVTTSYPANGDDTIGPESSLPTNLDVKIQEYEFDNSKGDTADKRKDIANWKLTGPELYNSPFALQLNNDNVRIKRDIIHKAQQLADKVNYLINSAGYPSLSIALQKDAQNFLASAQQIVNDVNLMHNYLTHSQTLIDLGNEWNQLEGNILGGMPRVKRSKS
jgi:hypothetical protein